MVIGLKAPALYALGVLIAGLAISWALAISPRRGTLLLGFCAVLAVAAASSFWYAAGMPLVLLATAQRFQEINREYGDAARSLGASEARILLRVTLPLAWPAILLAAILDLLSTIAGALR